MTSGPTTDGPVVLFDGVCSLCSGAVRFIVRHDPEGVFRFAPLQSEVASERLDECDGPVEDVDSIVLLVDGKCYVKSDAAILIAERLDFPYSLLGLTRYVPRFVRDAIYDGVAASRYRVFGKRDTCLAPTPSNRDRFLVDDSVASAETDESPGNDGV